MPLIAHIQFGDNSAEFYNKEYLVKDIQIHVARKYDDNHPIELAFCESIVLWIYVSADDDCNLFDWFISNSFEDGRIIIQLSDISESEGKRNSIILFYNARCFRIKEEYEIDINRRMVCLSFMADETIIDEEKFIR